MVTYISVGLQIQLWVPSNLLHSLYQHPPLATNKTNKNDQQTQEFQVASTTASMSNPIAYPANLGFES